MPKPTKLPREDRRSEIVQTTVTEAEKQHIDACAAAQRVSVSSWLRMVALQQVPEESAS